MPLISIITLTSAVYVLFYNSYVLYAGVFNRRASEYRGCAPLEMLNFACVLVLVSHGLANS